MTALGAAWSWLIDATPTWLWAVGLLFGFAASFRVWSPIWGLLPPAVRIAIIALITTAGAYLAGRHRGAANEKARQEKSRAAAASKRQEIDNEVDALSDSDVARRLDRWMRD